MTSTTGLCASAVFLLSLPVTVLYQAVFGTGAELVIHAALALGSALMSLAVFDFKTPRWVAGVGSASMGLLAVIFLLQGLSEAIRDESLTFLAYQVLGQGLEGWLVDLFLAWCVMVLVLAGELSKRLLGIIAVTTAVCVTVYAHVLTWRDTSLDEQAPMARMLWLMPFGWLLFESMTRPRRGR